MTQYKSKHGLLWLLLSGLMACGFNSCISDGEETIPIEYSTIDELVPGEWLVQNVSEVSYQTEGNLVKEVLTPLPFDANNQRIYTIYEGGNYMVSTSQKSYSWSSYNNTLYLDGVAYEVLSMGEERMLLRGSDNKCYDYKKVRTIEGEIPAEYLTSAVKVYSTEEYGSVAVRGLKLTIPRGAVPATNEGRPGRIAFSIDLLENNPYTLPSNYTLVSGVYKLEPMSFTFASPLILTFDLYGNDINDLVVFFYNLRTSSWEIIPFSRVNGDGTADCTTIELGYFALMKRKSSSTNLGGLRMNASSLESGYIYYLILNSAAQSNLTGKMTFTSGDADLLMPFLPLGKYTVVLARERRSDLSSNSTQLEYSSSQTVNIKTSLTGSGVSFRTYEGWTDISASGFRWYEGRPGSWGDPTPTYGTGKFQATLTWRNNSGRAVDYDLHLVQPRADEVFYHNKRSGNFELDRDWLKELGDATENIYSIGDNFDKGTYTVRVHHYSGATGINYSCRVIVNGVLVKSYSGILNSGYQEIYTFAVQ